MGVAAVTFNDLAGLAVGAGFARGTVMDDLADVTDRVVVIVHTGEPEVDDTPTSPIVLDDHTTRQRCEFEEDTVEEYFV